MYQTRPKDEITPRRKGTIGERVAGKGTAQADHDVLVHVLSQLEGTLYGNHLILSTWSAVDFGTQIGEARL